KVTEDQILSVLSNVRVETVLTAHPTEAKRSSVLEQHRAIYQLLVKRENSMWTPFEQEQIKEEVKSALERLWRTGEILVRKPEISEERRNVLHYLRHVFPKILPMLDLRLIQAWEKAGYDPKCFKEWKNLPMVQFGTWVGGDRDGHPFVTAEVTRETFKELRLNALFVLHQQMDLVIERLSLSHFVQKAPMEMTTVMSRIAEELGARSARLMGAYSEEPWRQFSVLIQAKLPVERVSGNQLEILEREGSYLYPEQMREDLRALYRSLVEIGAERIAESDVRPVLRMLEVFGFHSAQLDIRQNSQFHDLAMSQLMDAAGLNGKGFLSWGEEKRLKFLNQELKSSRPFTHGESSIGKEADAVLSCYRVLAEQIKQHGQQGIGALIVSMTRRLSDLLVVYVLAREAGLTEHSSDGLYCKLPVVPLFETVDDLRASEEMVRRYLAHTVTQRSLKAQLEFENQSLGRKRQYPSQQIMIGYSDSNKESGILAAQWELHRAQEAITKVGRKAHVNIRFFHGRGGTISRGAGPTHWFLESLPKNSIEGDFRVTEQGETVAQKYANLITGTHNLELLMAGATAQTVRHRFAKSKTYGLDKTLNRLCLTSRNSFRHFLEMDGFMTFYGQATPIDALEHSSIGSRPSRRTGSRTLGDLRAIPWVFSWNQARFYVPGWFGVGSALQDLHDNYSDDFHNLVSHVREWAFLNYLLTNVETSVYSADVEIMNAYAELVKEEKIRRQFTKVVSDEYLRTQEMLEKVFGKTFSARRPRMAKTLKLRADALKLLHYQQINLLERWRTAKSAEDEDTTRRLLPQILLSINAIASGLGTTG
ncbi:MAG: phosphoenolpyruvate carboxylase, partial [Verrucomicrobiota bacterium]